MLGSVIGDVVGSRFETQTLIDQPSRLFAPQCTFTDDTVCVAAVADSLVNSIPLHASFQRWVLRYPNAEYGGKFKSWALTCEGLPYGSFGNGGAMRVSPVALLGSTLDEVAAMAQGVTAVSHNHSDALSAAVILAESIFLALRGAPPQGVLQHIASRGVTLQSVAYYRDLARFSTDAAHTIGPALAAATAATSFEQAIRHCIAIGGDTDTICCMAGGLAEALFGIPDHLVDATLPFLPDDVVDALRALYARSDRNVLGIRSPAARPDVASPAPHPRSFLTRIGTLFG